MSPQHHPDELDSLVSTEWLAATLGAGDLVVLGRTTGCDAPSTASGPKEANPLLVNS